MPHKRESLRRSEPDVVQKAEQPEVIRRDDGLHTLDAQRAEIEEELRDQRMADAAMPPKPAASGLR